MRVGRTRLLLRRSYPRRRQPTGSLQRTNPNRVSGRSGYGAVCWRGGQRRPTLGGRIVRFVYSDTSGIYIFLLLIVPAGNIGKVHERIAMGVPIGTMAFQNEHARYVVTWFVQVHQRSYSVQLISP
jgi:hypothetical protein